MDWLFEANRDVDRRFPWISIPGVTSIVYRVISAFGTRNDVFWYPCCGTGINRKRRAFELLNAHDNATAIGLLGVNGRPESNNSDFAGPTRSSSFDANSMSFAAVARPRRLVSRSAPSVFGAVRFWSILRAWCFFRTFVLFD